MHRMAFDWLEKDWLVAPHRKPLVIRGARQVGKTWLVRQFAKRAKKRLVELNFEKQPQFTTLFTTNDTAQILANLSAALNQKIDVQDCLLFLDEIQAAPELLAKLRWFAEELPELPVIAAGSLLEFTLENHVFSMPVGRISYMHLEPLSFEEFLLARGKSFLHEYLGKFGYPAEMPLAIHDQLLSLFRGYVLVGGMPAAVSSWVEEQSLPNVNQIHHDLLATYRDDFSKYNDRIPLERLDEVLMFVPRRLGQKFMYSKVNSSLNVNTVKQAISLLNKARICHRVSGCAANGTPLAAEIREKYFKEIFLDVGLANAAFGLGFYSTNVVQDRDFINKGEIAEQVCGQMLRTIEPFYIEPALYYWHRDVEGSSAEIDYVIQHGNKIVPIEVKAGSAGSLKSLHLFMGLKNLDTAIRINADLPTKTTVDVKGHNGNNIHYTLLSIPFYLTGQIHRLLADEDEGKTV